MDFIAISDAASCPNPGVVAFARCWGILFCCDYTSIKQLGFFFSQFSLN
jgi:hypothetical protein